MTKTCSKCNESKPDTAFYAGQRWCKECHKAYYRAYYQRPEVKAARRAENLTPGDLERIRGYERFWRGQHKQK